MTPNKEDYLLALYRLGTSDELVSNKKIATELGVAPASVSEMLSRMGEEDLIEIVPYKGSRLTQSGQAAVIPLLRSHRLWEVFLIRHLGYSWSEAHEDAHILEHCAPQRMVERLDYFLNYPVYCPHGESIPRADAQPAEPKDLRPLTAVPVGQHAHICKVMEEKELLDYLQSLGLAIGSEIFVEKADPYEGPLTIMMNEQKLTISYKAASKIMVDGNAPARKTALGKEG